MINSGHFYIFKDLFYLVRREIQLIEKLLLKMAVVDELSLFLHARAGSTSRFIRASAQAEFNIAARLALV
jgi:hypothetical protein